MKFDMFTAVNDVHKTTGLPSEVLIIKSGIDYEIRLQVFDTNKQFKVSQFVVPFNMLDDAYLDIMTDKFNTALRYLKEILE